MKQAGRTRKRDRATGPHTQLKGKQSRRRVDSMVQWQLSDQGSIQTATHSMAEFPPDVHKRMVNELATDVNFEKFTWRIEDFSKQDTLKLSSKKFVIRGYTWRILVCPLRRDVKHFSLYLMVVDSLPPFGWSRNTFFNLVLINQVDRKNSIVKETKQKFNGGHRCWGSFFLNLDDLYDRKQGYLVSDTCIIEVNICVSAFGFTKIQDIYSLNLPNSTPTNGSKFDQATNQRPSDERDTTPSPKTSSGSSRREGEIQGSSDLATLTELMDLESLKPEEQALFPLLEGVCKRRPSLIQSQTKSSRLFRQWAFTSLGRVLHFLKTKKVKDISEDDCKYLQGLWEELVKSSGFDLAWLEPYVQSALGVKANLKKLQQLRKLTDKVIALELKMRKQRGELAAAEEEFKVAKRGLSEVRNGFQAMNVDAPIGYAMF
ncbi:MATH domain and coiled-coil domain-containing protein At3g58210-like isoform X2 [Lotus japonicus]|uniref:MATH domain and coiled-coil domain-containing protein At3g58210-like isoform X2 n=1 Tax=Lotus japonicus TaxID=34305 RepID=UPI002587AAE6|nr:MATH domain and coiled-coil domain-containing protein At3g58210-like isoform X2 [Lotus japonicus]